MLKGSLCIAHCKKEQVRRYYIFTVPVVLTFFSDLREQFCIIQEN